MQKSYRDFINEVKNKSIMFYGVGKSNLPFINMLTKEKIKIAVYDSRNKESFSSDILKLLDSNEYIDLRIGDKSIWDEFFEIIIRSPGVNFFSEEIKKAKNNGSIITSEMEIFFDLCPCKIIGITGSDGKTTTTTIISEILKTDGKKVHLGGNIGTPLLPEINNINKDDIVVVELSSFQLISMRKSPDISLITNISPNHLDVHSNMEEYIEAKKQILLHQNAFSRTVLNFSNSETNKMSSLVRGKTLFFDISQKLSNGVWVNEHNEIIFSDNNKQEFILNVADIKLPGKHNLENYLAAIACTKDIVKNDSIIKVAKNFNGVEHRMEFVKEINGVSYYNDSIASTPTRTISGALSLFNKKVILIAGGYDKKVPFNIFAKEIIKKVSTLILIGDTANKIKEEIINLKEYNPNSLKIFIKEDMEDAVFEANRNSVSGDIVVLSPACASFDMYKNFEERGNHFKNIVNKYKENKKD